MKHKYVRHDQLGFVLWPMTDDLFHSHVSALVGAEVRGGFLSAGFAYIANGSVRCDGRSESMHLDSRPDDSEALARQLGLRAAAVDRAPAAHEVAHERVRRMNKADKKAAKRDRYRERGMQSMDPLRARELAASSATDGVAPASSVSREGSNS